MIVSDSLKVGRNISKIYVLIYVVVSS
jgi:hypothetical protein